METRKKNLIVLTGYDDFKVIEPHLLERCDILAMTPSAMFACQKRCLKCFSPDDFYHYRQFSVDNLRLIQETEELFSALDKKYRDFLDYPRAFKGNIYPFLIFFSDLHYISKVGREVSHQYEKVYLIGIPIEKDSFTINFKFCLSLVWFPDYNVASRSGLNLFAACLSAQLVWLRFNKPKKRFKGINKYQILYLGKRIYRKIIAIIKPCFFKKQKGVKKIIFTVVDGYEPSLLKKHLPEFLFMDSVMESLRTIRNDKEKRLNLKLLFLEELKGFVKNWFPHFEKYVLELFVLYHNEVLCFLNSFSKELKKAFNEHQPLALFYSVGALSIYEDICGYFANQMNIPVFYFQHAGAAQSAFSPHPFQRYIEHNENITKINIFQSKKEKENLSKNKDATVDGPVLGSMKLYNIYMGRKKNVLSQKRMALYCPNLLPFCCYNNCMWSRSDKLLFEVNQSIIESVHKLDVRMDIKVIPSYHEAEDYYYFKQLIKRQKNAKTRILTGFPAEKIINNYGLFLLDGIVTAVLPVFALLDIPIILYLKDTSFIYQEVIYDMMERFYFAKSNSDLEKYLSLLARGELPSKFSPDFVDKYAFPIEHGDPGIRISNYIRKQLNK